MLRDLIEEYVVQFLELQEITTCSSIVGINTKLGTSPNIPSEPKVIKRRKQRKSK